MKTLKRSRSTLYEFSVVLIALLSLVMTSCAPANAIPSNLTETLGGAAASTPSPTRTPDATPTQATPIHMQVEGADLEGVAIRFVHPWAGEMADTLQAVAMQFSLYNEWGIWVDVEALGSDSALIHALEADLAAGDVPGLIATYPYLVEPLNGQYFSVNLRDYFDDPVWGFDPEAQADIPEIFLDQFILDGILMALPLAPQATVLFYNQTWGEELGFTTPPLDEGAFRDQSCAATRYNNEDDVVDNNGTGGWVINFHPNVLAGWHRAFGGELPEVALPTFNDTAGQDALGYLRAVYQEQSVFYQGCIWVGRQPDPYPYFVNRYALMYAGTLDQIPVQMGWLEEFGSEDAWGVLGIPGPDGPVMVVDGPGLMVTADTPEQQMAAWLFGRYLLSPDIQARLVQSGFSLPVRRSAMDLLADFSTTYPQWAEAVDLLDHAYTVPVSAAWGMSQWVWQDAYLRIMQPVEVDIPAILDEAGAILAELEGMGP